MAQKNKIIAVSARRMSGLAMALLLAGAVAGAGCTNSGLKKVASSSSSYTGANGAANVVTSYGNYSISAVSVGSSAINAQSAYEVDINFAATTGSPQVTNICSSDLTSQPCVCEYQWTDVNTTGAAPVYTNRTVYQSPTQVQPFEVICPSPNNWQTEIPDNTTINVTVLPGTGNTKQFSVSTYHFVKGQNTETGNFKDAMGRSYVNILRYTCYEQRNRGISLVNAGFSQTPYLDLSSYGLSNATSFNYISGNQFTLLKLDATTVKGASSYSGTLTHDYSNQSYYYNMFIRDSESGDINVGNANFVCPAVTESLNQQKDSGGNPIVGTQGKFWPMDTSFALSLGKTSDYSVGVQANSKTTNPNDPTAQNSNCDGTTSGSQTANGLIHSCLGFAAKANVDGTCPPIVVNKVNNVCPAGTTANSSGTCNQPTYRLRRYISILPPIYDTDGTWPAEAQRSDMVYVLDRPLVDASGNVITDANGSPYSMLGPKPCPYALYDSHNVTNASFDALAGLTTSTVPQYHGTNSTAWSGSLDPNHIDQNIQTGTNVDDIHFPWQDSGNPNSGTCAASLPLVSADLSKVSLTTITKKLYVRPMKPFSPHYEEDTGFQACAPQANPLRDPPLHFAVNGTGVAWCAEVYPTQNDNATKLGVSWNGAAGTTKLYTSHVVKNSTGGGACPAASSSTGINFHANFGETATCDRTVVNPADGIGWNKFPLLAPEADVVAALQSDSAYKCTVSYDAAGAKSTNGLTPTGGCCANATPSAGVGNSAHLDPVALPTGTPVPYPVSCTPPQY